MKEDLEALTGKLIQGDLTPIVIELLERDKTHKMQLLDYSAFCSDENLKRKIGGIKHGFSKPKDSTTSVQKDNSRLSIAEWARNRCVE